MEAKRLPVYQQKERILEAVQSHQVIIVESPTGSGKTTQIPIILHEAGYGSSGIIGVTQPRRIATLSVTDYIARQLGSSVPGLVGYKMRFEDKTDQSTRIKILTDGMLLQEMKLDPYLLKYSVVMVDEAHERSLTIDFILGLLKRILEARSDFKVIISSATINTQVFSEYFGECPIVSIDTPTYPVTLIYDPVREAQEESIPPRSADELLIAKIESIVGRVVEEGREGDILVFLSGERLIKACAQRLELGEHRRSLQVLPLYARLAKEEQERIFDPPPPGKKKVVVATNIAETSVTIDGITCVIDSGLAKLNYYSPRSFTSSLVEMPTSKASSNQRKGRAGRTRPGVCYRLFTREDFEKRPLFTLEEISRTDLSEVLLRMAELGIRDFESFDFISRPSKEAIRGALDVLSLLDALDPDRGLSKIGQMMCKFPLMPRLSRMIVEAIMRYPDVIEEVLIAAAFLSTQSPYLLPAGEELEARRAHHAFRDPAGDFVSYIRVLRAYEASRRKDEFCERSYLDERAMREILNVKSQLEEIVSSLGVPIGKGGSVEHYLCAVSRGLIQFVCMRSGRDTYSSLTADRIQIHPGSVMFKENPPYIVAGEIVRTTRMYAMSVSPLKPEWLHSISPEIAKASGLAKGKHAALAKEERDFTNQVKIGSGLYAIEKSKDGKKFVSLKWSRLKHDIAEMDWSRLGMYGELKGRIEWEGYSIMEGEKLELILRVARGLDPDRDLNAPWPKKSRYTMPEDLPRLLGQIGMTLRLARNQGKGKTKGRELGFITLHSNEAGHYWFNLSRGFHTALNASLSSLEGLIDAISDDAPLEYLEGLKATYARLASFFSRD
jgi:RNA helicase HrpA